MKIIIHLVSFVIIHIVFYLKLGILWLGPPSVFLDGFFFDEILYLIVTNTVLLFIYGIGHFIVSNWKKGNTNLGDGRHKTNYKGVLFIGVSILIVLWLWLSLKDYF